MTADQIINALCQTALADGLSYQALVTDLTTKLATAQSDAAEHTKAAQEICDKFGYDFSALTTQVKATAAVDVLNVS
jgi:hypothetical protein